MRPKQGIPNRRRAAESRVPAERTIALAQQALADELRFGSQNPTMTSRSATGSMKMMGRTTKPDPRFGETMTRVAAFAYCDRRCEIGGDSSTMSISSTLVRRIDETPNGAGSKKETDDAGHGVA